MSEDSQFLFISESLALDLVNTEMVVRGKPFDALRTPGDLVAWWDEVRRHHQIAAIEPAATADARTGASDQAALAAIARMRGALRRICDAVVNGSAPGAADLAIVNQELGRGRHRLAPGDDHPVGASYAVEGGAAAAMGFALALSALQLLTTMDLGRLHRCQNARCILFFYDTTKSATRRWCSAACMNRARSAQHYAEHKQRDEQRG